MQKKCFRGTEQEEITPSWPSLHIIKFIKQKNKKAQGQCFIPFAGCLQYINKSNKDLFIKEKRWLLFSYRLPWSGIISLWIYRLTFLVLNLVKHTSAASTPIPGIECCRFIHSLLKKQTQWPGQSAPLSEIGYSVWGCKCRIVIAFACTVTALPV